MATLNYNPSSGLPSPVTSTLTFGTVPDGMITGKWYRHKLMLDTDSYFSEVTLSLNVTNVAYGGRTAILSDTPMRALLSSTAPQLLYLGADGAELFANWA